ncbi:MAG: type II toxin-antitoxin system MqsA family antitoxin [Methylococcales bacterium]
MSKSAIVTCTYCGKQGARVRKSTRAYGKGNDLLVIENVPMISCPNCGESYFKAETMHELERIKRNQRNYATERLVRVAEYADIEPQSNTILSKTA